MVKGGEPPPHLTEHWSCSSCGVLLWGTEDIRPECPRCGLATGELYPIKAATAASLPTKAQQQAESARPLSEPGKATAVRGKVRQAQSMNRDSP